MAKEHPLLKVQQRLLIFGGKGGVGKTTAAAAASLAIAEHRRQERVLLFSTDPAHSLSDSLNEKVGNRREGVAGLENLDAMEIDPAVRFEGLKERYRRWAEGLSGGKEGSWQIQFDREAIQELFSLAPPGIDEIAALSVMIELLDTGSYSAFVLDTAPTGHLIRFLELPEIALSWVQTFMRLLLKYKELTRSALQRGESMFVDIGEELLTLSKNIKRMTALLGDSRQCEFVGVAVPENMSLLETERLIRRLKGLKTPMRRLLINNVIPDEAAKGCGFCAARRSMQEGVLRNYVSKFRSKLQLLTAPQQPYEIRGRDRLMAHFTQWREL